MDKLDAYIAFFENIRRDNLGELDALVTPDVRFKDPFNDVAGVDAMRACLAMAFDHGTPRFTVKDRARGAHGAYLLWHYDNGAGFAFDGMSEIRLADDGRIAAHIDHWDAGEHLYLKLPVLGWLVGLVRKRLKVRA
jgi:steroid Delta-isomerase